MSEEAVALDPELFGKDSPCFGCAPSHPIGFHLRFTKQNDTVSTRFTPAAQYQGPPGIMHGGLVTALADEVAAWTVIGLRERFAFTASIEAKLRAPIRVGVEVLGTGRIISDLRRILEIEVTLSQRDVEAFKGVFKFAVLERAAAEKLLGGLLPAEWERFAR